MTRIFFLPLLLILSSSCNQESKLFPDCSCEQVDLSDGQTIRDSLDHFQITYPDSSWLPTLNLDSNGNGITVGDTSQGYLRLFGITELGRDFDVDDWEQQQAEIESQFDVIEKGRLGYLNQDVPWNLVRLGADGLWTLYLTVNHPKEERFYTVNLTVEDGENVKNRLCTLESFLDGFEIVE